MTERQMRFFSVSRHNSKVQTHTKKFVMSSEVIKGKVKLAKQPHYRDKTIADKKHPKLDGYTNIQVCSNVKRGKEVSPMCLGPITEHLEVDKHGKLLPPAVLFENFWQGIKCFTFELDEKTSTILPIYFDRREKNFSDTKPHRRVYPKKVLIEKKAKVEFSYFNGKRYGWVEARKLIYCPMYAEMVTKTRYFKELKYRLEQGENLLIIGYDGFSFDPERDDAKAHLEDTSKSVGHEFVICCLLAGITPWI
jgi:hypothetical protein